MNTAPVSSLCRCCFVAVIAAATLVAIPVAAQQPMRPRPMQQQPMAYIPAPVDNPLKGLVPYARPHADRFPHSMEFSYLSLGELMIGPEQFDWKPLEQLLDDVASRGNQTVFRVWLEYPGRTDGIPRFLEKNGLQVTEWVDKSEGSSPAKKIRTPDYSDPALRTALQSFIAAMGKRYDGDPRIGFITAGLLGVWGEWHTYPREELMADKTVQAEIMTAYEQAFRTTPILLRYPAGDDAYSHAANDRREFGYHDDSFAWATLDTGRKADDWFYIPALKAAGPRAINKWQTQPIGGEIRPELWGLIFDEQPDHKQAQDFASCVRETHVSWLMDTGMFRKQQSAARIANATKQVQKMGYEFHVQWFAREFSTNGEPTLTVQVQNTGVAPFYYDWQVELAIVRDGKIVREIPVDWSINGLLPGEPSRQWSTTVPVPDAASKYDHFAIRVVNPLPSGKPLRFANEYHQPAPAGWLLLRSK
jgi:hypothetical protein